MWVSFLLLAFGTASPASEITTLWLSHGSNDPTRLTVNWESSAPGTSIVHFGVTAACEQVVNVEDAATLHHVEIPIIERGARYHYWVETAGARSAVHSFRSLPTDTLRIAVVADWLERKGLAALLADQPHLLVSAGDHVYNLHALCGVGKTACTAPFSELIRAYPQLFATIPFMPTMGNHDREVRPRAGKEPPSEPVYDIDATAYRAFFALPGQEWMWHLDLPPFDLRLISLDLQHISDLGTTYQSCHAFARGSPQFEAYAALMTATEQPSFTVTLMNERSATMRNQEGGAWHQLFRRGTATVTGFGYFAERAVVDGFSYYNTALSGKGAKYPDPKSVFLASEDSYLLITAHVGSESLRFELKGLDGKVLHAVDESRTKPRSSPAP